MTESSLISSGQGVIRLLVLSNQETKTKKADQRVAAIIQFMINMVHFSSHKSQIDSDSLLIGQYKTFEDVTLGSVKV